MSYEHKEGQGSIFKNDQKGNDKAPTMKGTALIGGRLYEIAGWTRETQKGAKWLSLSIKPKEPKPEAQRTPAQASIAAQGGQFEDDEIPF